MKWKNTLCSMGVICTVLFGGISAHAEINYDGVDANYFSLNQLILETDTAAPGDRVEIIVDANNKMPDLSEVVGEVSTPDGEIIKVPFYRAYYADVDQAIKGGIHYSMDEPVFDNHEREHRYYSATLKIPKDTSVGEYQLVSLSLQDFDRKRLKYVLDGQEALHAVRGKVLPDGVTVSVGLDSLPKLVDCSTAVKSSGSSSNVTILARATNGTQRITLKFRSEETGKPYLLRMDEDDYDGASKAFKALFELPVSEAGSTMRLEAVTIRNEDRVFQKYLWSPTVYDTDALKLDVDFTFHVPDGLE